MKAFHRKHPISLALIALLVISASVIAGFSAWAAESREEKQPVKFTLSDFPKQKQLPNYCGPASLSSVLKFWGKTDQTQDLIGKCVYDKRIQATNGADLLVYARTIGFSAYSFNGTIDGIKQLLAQGLPVIVLQDTSKLDRSGHFRVAIGYDDATKSIFVADPYEITRTKFSYDEFKSLWDTRGDWGLLVMPNDKDNFAKQMNDRNPVVHLDLAQAYYRKGILDDADREIRTALRLEPGNPSAEELLNQIQFTRGATGN